MSNELSRREMSREEHNRLHELLHTLCVHLPTDFEPYGQRSREEDWARIVRAVAGTSWNWSGRWAPTGASAPIIRARALDC